MKRAVLLALLLLATSAGGQTSRFNTGYEEPKVWTEKQDIIPPAFPSEATLQQIYVGAVATNTYFIDTATLTLDDDAVVRYVLVVRTSGGATNVTFEGMHCETRRWKHYATGRSDKTWSVSRAAHQDWRPIENKPTNPHHAALSRNFFCPQGNPIRSADDGREALRKGKHPNAI